MVYSPLVSTLEARMSRVLGASSQTFKSELASLRSFIQRSGALQSIATSIDDAAPGFDPAEWVKTVEYQGTEFPAAEPEYMKLLQHLLLRFATDDFRGFGLTVMHERNFTDAANRIARELIQPYTQYLAERLGTESQIVHTIARYAQRVEWFTGDSLFKAYELDTSRGEATYERDFRRFLFDQGVDHPFSNPVSPSGRSDVIALLDTTDPLVCEVKLYNGSSYNVSYVAKGLKQAHRYGRDYKKRTAHLVVFNLSDEALQFPNDHADTKGPPSVSVAGVRVYLHVIQAKPLGAASEPGKLKPRAISRADLVHEIEEGSE